MPRGKPLSVEEKSFIDGLCSSCNTKKPKITHLTKVLNENFNSKRSYQVVSNYLRNRTTYGTRFSSGRPPKVSQRLRRSIVKQVLIKNSNGPVSLRNLARKISHENDTSVSHMTISRVLKDSPKISLLKMKGKPVLKAHHKLKRLDFAKSQLLTPSRWLDILWSDEKWFTLQGPDFYKTYWHHCADELKTRVKSQKSGGGIMIWGLFSGSGETAIEVVDGSLKSDRYISILEDKLIPIYNSMLESDSEPFFMQDNAAVHTARVTKAFLEENNVSVLDWPPLSPDLNPIENLWGILSGRVYGGNQQYLTKDALKLKIIEEWQNISKDTLKSLASSVPKRLLAVVERQGGFLDN